MKCQCPAAGYCETHKRTMSKGQHEKCASSDALFEGFAKLKGRCMGLGDAVAKVTRATGIQAAAKVVAKLRGKPCGCGKRQDALNAAMPFTGPASSPSQP